MTASALFHQHEIGRRRIVVQHALRFSGGDTDCTRPLQQANNCDLLALDNAVSDRAVNAFAQRSLAPTVHEDFRHSKRLDQTLIVHGCYSPAERSGNDTRKSENCTRKLRDEMRFRFRSAGIEFRHDRVTARDVSATVHRSRFQNTRTSFHSSRGGVEKLTRKIGNKSGAAPEAEKNSSATEFVRVSVRGAAIQPCAGVAPGPRETLSPVQVHSFPASQLAGGGHASPVFSLDHDRFHSLKLATGVPDTEQAA